MNTVELRIQLTDDQAWNLALFLTRIGFAEFRNHATSQEEAYDMRNAAGLIRRALIERGVRAALAWKIRVF